MTYTQLALVGVALTIVIDVSVLRTKLVRRKVFWYSYGIIVIFQLISNGFLTGYEMVQYDGDAIIGQTSPQHSPPPFIGQGRICFAPVEDLFFGFALILLTLSLWMWWERRGIQSDIHAGPPRESVRALVRYEE